MRPLAFNKILIHDYFRVLGDFRLGKKFSYLLVVTSRAVKSLLFAALFLYAIWAYPAEASMKCSTLDSLLGESIKDGYAFMASAIDTRGITLMFMLRMEDARFRVIGVDNDLNACTMLEGVQWQFELIQPASLH
jgi:hypothetical protein